MVDTNFVKFKGPLSLKALVELTGAQLFRGAPDFLVQGVAHLETASPQDLSLFHNPKYQDALSQTHAGVVVLTESVVSQAPPQAALLIAPHPLKVFAQILKALYEEMPPAWDIHPTASIDPTAVLGAGCRVGPYVVIEAHATLGPHCWIDAHAVIGRGVILGERARIGTHVTLSHTVVGKNVTIKPGARVGQQGFGFFMDESAGLHEHQLQLGRVVIGDHVEIGANTTIDRGSLKDTVIEAFARIDNLVQIAHNVHIGRGVVLVAQVGIAGSTVIGDLSVLGGQVGVAGHLTLGSGVKVAAKSGVMHSIPNSEAFGGIPAVPIQEWRRQSVLLRKMAQKKALSEIQREKQNDGATRGSIRA